MAKLQQPLLLNLPREGRWRALLSCLACHFWPMWWGYPHIRMSNMYTWNCTLIKGSWEAIFRVADDFYSMKGGVWLYTQWRVVCDFTSHNNEKCETIFNEGWCVTLHHTTMRSVRLYSMKGGVWLYITQQWEWHCNGCMNVAWASFWAGSRSTKPCVFLCKVAAAGDERYLVCAAGAAALEPRRNRFLHCLLQRVVVHVCVVLCVCCISGCRLLCIMAAWLLSFCVAMCVERSGFATWCCKTHCHGCVKVAWRHGCVRNTFVFCSWIS